MGDAGSDGAPRGRGHRRWGARLQARDAPRGAPLPHGPARPRQHRGARHRDRHALGARHRAGGRAGLRAPQRHPGRLQLDGEEGPGHRPPRSRAVQGGAGFGARQHPPDGGRRRQVQGHAGAGHLPRQPRQAAQRAGHHGPAGLRERHGPGPHRQGRSRGAVRQPGAGARAGAPGGHQPRLLHHHLAHRRHRDLAQRRRRADRGGLALGAGALHHRRGSAQDAGRHQRHRGRRRQAARRHARDLRRGRLRQRALHRRHPADPQRRDHRAERGHLRCGHRGREQRAQAPPRDDGQRHHQLRPPRGRAPRAQRRAPLPPAALAGERAALGLRRPAGRPAGGLRRLGPHLGRPLRSGHARRRLREPGGGGQRFPRRRRPQPRGLRQRPPAPRSRRARRAGCRNTSG